MNFDEIFESGMTLVDVLKKDKKSDAIPVPFDGKTVEAILINGVYLNLNSRNSCKKTDENLKEILSYTITSKHGKYWLNPPKQGMRRLL